MSTKHDLSNARARFAQGLRCLKVARLLPLLLCAVLLSGCAHRYDIMLTNGTRVTNVTKPVLDRSNGVFNYKDVAGNAHKVNAGRVVDIGPHSAKNEVPDPTR
jgi:hypothetical protein